MSYPTKQSDWRLNSLFQMTQIPPLKRACHNCIYIHSTIMTHPWEPKRKYNLALKVQNWGWIQKFVPPGWNSSTNPFSGSFLLGSPDLQFITRCRWTCEDKLAFTFKAFLLTMYSVCCSVWLIGCVVGLINLLLRAVGSSMVVLAILYLTRNWHFF